MSNAMNKWEIVKGSAGEGSPACPLRRTSLSVPVASRPSSSSSPNIKQRISAASNSPVRNSVFSAEFVCATQTKPPSKIPRRTIAHAHAPPRVSASSSPQRLVKRRTGFQAPSIEDVVQNRMNVAARKARFSEDIDEIPSEIPSAIETGILHTKSAPSLLSAPLRRTVFSPSSNDESSHRASVPRNLLQQNFRQRLGEYVVGKTGHADEACVKSPYADAMQTIRSLGSGGKAQEWFLSQLKMLEEGDVARGIDALRFVLSNKCESLSHAFSRLDYNDNGELSMLEFAGGLAMLLPPMHGQNAVRLLTGMNEQQLFSILDDNRSGTIELGEFAGEGAVRVRSEHPTRTTKQINFPMKRPTVVGKFGGQMRFEAAVRKVQEGLRKRREEELSTSAYPPQIFVVAAKWSSLCARQHCRKMGSDVSGEPDSQDEDEITSAMEYEEQQLRHIFDAACGGYRKRSMFLLQRPRFFEFFHEMDESKLTDNVLHSLFDSQLELQQDLSLASNGIAISEGLTFDSFRVCLHRISVRLKLSLHRVVGDLISEYEELASQRVRAWKLERKNKAQK